MDKWLATVENLSASDREKYEKEKVGVAEEGAGANNEAADKAAEAAKLAYQKEQALLTSQKIQIKTFKNFEYYPIIFYEGVRPDNPNKDKKTIIHVNVGGQVFRMQQAEFKGGILS